MEKGAHKLEERTTFRENLGKLLVDLGKLIFGSLFLGGILRGELPQVIVIMGGFTVAVLFCAVGIRWVSTKDKGD